MYIHLYLQIDIKSFPFWEFRFENRWEWILHALTCKLSANTIHLRLKHLN